MSVPSTYDKVIKTPGNGPAIQRGQKVTVHCTGYGKNKDLNEKFWSTKDPGQEPFSFQVGMGQVIKCWDEGVLTMKVGEKSELTCSPAYGYGAGGFPAWGIMPNSVLKFEIEVLKAQ
jgi:peptidylprolyl isomerase